MKKKVKSLSNKDVKRTLKDIKSMKKGMKKSGNNASTVGTPNEELAKFNRSRGNAKRTRP